jgi:hypothetical protein
MQILRTLGAELRPITRTSRVLYWGAAFWLLSAAVHMVALAADDWAWAGAVSFRKPITFSLSIGALLATTGWALDRLPGRPRSKSVLAWALLVSSTAEVGLITLQAWRGRASHFNTLESGDAVIFAAMGAMVGVMSLCLLTLFVWSIRRRPLQRLDAIALIAGLALVMTGLGIGQWIIELGNEYVASNGAVPDTVTYGQDGVAKFPHAVAFHGVQVFILAAVLLRLGSLSDRARRRLMTLIVSGYIGILVFASIQTVSGRAPLDIGPWSLGMTLSAAGVLVGGLIAMRGLRTATVPEEAAPVSVA